MRKALVFAMLVAPVMADEAQTAFETLKKEYSAAVEEFYRPVREAYAKGEKVQIDMTKHPNNAYAAKFAAFAKEHPKTDAAAESLAMLLQMSQDEATQKEAVETLLRDHIESATLKGAIYSFGPADLRTVAEKSPHAEVRGFALLRLAEIHAEAGEEKDAIALFREVKEKYADIPWYQGTLGQRADGGIFEIENLGVGKAAPEVQGEDLDGKPMKLSDFRGKVVVLDFWGDW